MEFAFGKHEIYVGQTEEGIVGGVEHGVAVGLILGFVLVVGFRGVDILDAHVALILVAEVFDFGSVVALVHQTAVVTVGKCLGEFFAHTRSGPS